MRIPCANTGQIPGSGQGAGGMARHCTHAWHMKGYGTGMTAFTGEMGTARLDASGALSHPFASTGDIRIFAAIDCGRDGDAVPTARFFLEAIPRIGTPPGYIFRFTQSGRQPAPPPRADIPTTSPGCVSFA